MSDQLYREVVGLGADAPLPAACERCREAVDATNRHLVVVVDDYAAGGDDQAWCLCAECAELCVGGVAERVEEPVD